MKSPDRGRYPRCEATGKIIYPSMAKARRSIIDMERSDRFRASIGIRKSSTKRGKMQAYRCPYCGWQIHLGHPPQVEAS